MKGVILILSLLIPLLGQAQNVKVSASSKLSSKEPRFKVLGKNEDGIIFRKYGKGSTTLEVYDDELKLIRAKYLNLEGDEVETEHILLNNQGATVYYTDRYKNYSYLIAQKINSNMEAFGPKQILDTINADRDFVEEELRYKTAQNSSSALFYYPIEEDNMVKSVRCVAVTRDMGILYRETLAISEPSEYKEVHRVLMDNDGNGVVVMRVNDEKEKDDAEGENYEVYLLNVETKLISRFNIQSNFEMYGSTRFDIDNVHSSLVVTGFYTENVKEEKEAAEGVFQVIHSLEDGSIISESRTRFDTRFIFDLTGKDTVKNKESKLYTFEIKKVILRLDGGALILAESSYSDADDVEVPNIMNPNYSSYRTINVYYYNDILAFSIDSMGNVDWNAILRKKQVSEDDNGSFSSFTVMNSKDKLRIIYLDEIYTGGNVSEYLLTGEGELDRSVLINQKEIDAMIIPKLGKQVSFNEIVIPSYKRNNVSLVKLTF